MAIKLCINIKLKKFFQHLIDLAIAAYIEDQWKKTPEVVDEKMEVTNLSRVRGAGIIGDFRHKSTNLMACLTISSQFIVGKKIVPIKS